MKVWEKRLLKYCEKQGLLTPQNAVQISKARENQEEANILIFLKQHLGWDDKTAREYLDKACGTATGVSNRTQKALTKIKEHGKGKSVGERAIEWGKERFGEYILLEKIGAGGMGVVYKVYHPGLDKQFAIKTLHPDQSDGDEMIKRFSREARVVAKLRHPNIIAVHNIAEEQGKHYIVMDYVKGKELGDIIKDEGKILPMRALTIALHIAKALDYSHEQGIIHRDIKPSNILISKENGKETPYLMDFGLAAVIKEKKLTQTGRVIGTPQFMSPEQAKGMEMDKRSDIYSFGTVLYEMITGNCAVGSDQVMAILYEVIEKEPIPIQRHVPGIAKDIEAITMKCMEKSPANRYQTAKELVDDIERYLRGEAVLARSPGFVSRTWRKIRRNWKISVSVLVLILLCIGTWILCLPDAVTIQIMSLREQAIGLEKDGNLKGAADIYFNILNNLDKSNEEAKGEFDRIKGKMLKKGQEKEKETDLKEAMKIYNELVKLDEKYIDAKLGIKRIEDKIKQEWDKVEALIKERYFNKALKTCQTIITWNVKDENFGDKVISITNMRDDCLSKALQPYNQAMEIFWNPELNEAEIKKCKELFEKATDEYPEFVDAHLLAGRAAHRLFDNKSAIEHYKYSLELAPNLTAPRYYRTILELPSVKFDSQDYLKSYTDKYKDIWTDREGKLPVIDQDTKDPYVILAYVQLLIYRILAFRESDDTKKDSDNAYENALGLCAKVIESHPNNFSQAYFMRAQLYSYPMVIDKDTPLIFTLFGMKEPGKALKECDKAIYLDPYRMEGYTLRGFIYKTIGAYSLAEQDFTRALLLKNVSKQFFYIQRAICYIEMEEPDLAMKDIESSLAITKNKEDSQKAEGLLWQCMINAWGEKTNDSKNKIEELSFLKEVEEFQVNAFFKTLVYLMADDGVDKARGTWQKFLQTNKDHIMKPLGAFVTTQGKYCDDFINHICTFIQEIPNLFCKSPELKKFREKDFKFLRLVYNMLQLHPLIKKAGADRGFNLSLIIRKCIQTLKKDPAGKEKLRQINSISKEFETPVNIELLLSFAIQLDEYKMNQILHNLDDLPLASLYYRRAVSYYIEGEIEKARDDLKQALKLEPNFMEAHYGLSTVYSLLLSRTGNDSYRKAALYHLKQAIETGWNKLEDYTLKDDDFKSLELTKHMNELRSWDKARKDNESRISELLENVKELTSSGESVYALRLLYNSGFTYQLREAINNAENNVIQDFLKNLKEPITPDDDRKVKSILSQRGGIKWEWEKEKAMDKGK